MERFMPPVLLVDLRLSPSLREGHFWIDTLKQNQTLFCRPGAAFVCGAEPYFFCGVPVITSGSIHGTVLLPPIAV